MSEIRDVVVVGAGPTGLALAIALRQYGIDVVVVEKEARGKREARAGVVWQRALEVLRDLGCVEAFLAEGLALRRVEVLAEGREVGGIDLGAGETAYPRPLSIEQDAVERLLGERLREVGGEIRWSTEAVGVRTSDDGAVVELRGADGLATSVRCHWVVGCEGAHSMVRKALGIPFEGARRPDLQCVQINAEADWKHPYAPDRSYFFLVRGASLGVSPRPGGGYRFFCFSTDPDPTIERAPTVEEMRALVADAAHDPGTTLVPTDPPWANRARFQDRFAGSLRVGRALLAGDSAHLWAPIGGHGLNTGLRGAHNLGWKLAAVHRGWAVDALLDTYATEQRLTARKVMRAMRHDVLELPPTRLTLLGMRLAGPHLMRREWFAGRIRTVLSDLTMHHRESRLSESNPSRYRSLLAGDRLPDLPVLLDGRRRRLHELLSYERWTLLAAPGARVDDDRLRRLTDGYAMPVEHVRPYPARSARRRLAGAGSLILVRPDRHIGISTDTVEELEAYLRRWFTPRGQDREQDRP
ncbi:FAD-dependent oxidoreductase [Streptomyces syringium]|uniref:2-polyprenyl-6-methoxyphenol hydroxylase-like FAD-dependent oxidoreductase n=1 Tax=Streptomyces syringium TaxID=76729 RepID=A0ABS4YBA6_9ACTN|nr:FAD-dependent oxidoreductase [Streptomyces syringium]MBP2406076.1 2-polyprenyl-6-methoxyphenol hydroxylase-like FAD-dependent oxidoreductase [Streptomyces syringium]